MLFLLRAQTPKRGSNCQTYTAAETRCSDSCVSETGLHETTRWIGWAEQVGGEALGRFGHESEMLWLWTCVVVTPDFLVSPSRISITPPLSLFCDHFFCDTESKWPCICPLFIWFVYSSYSLLSHGLAPQWQYFFWLTERKLNLRLVLSGGHGQSHGHRQVVGNTGQLSDETELLQIL